jgi:hypothetical protein
MFRTSIALRARSELGALEWQMWQLASTFFDLSRELWLQRFRNTEEYSLFYHSERLVGFAGVEAREFSLSRRGVWAVALNQAVVLPEYRGRHFLQRSLIRVIWRQLRRNPGTPVYLWGNCAHYRSYLAFAKSLEHTYPSWQRETPVEARELLHSLGTRFGADYDPESHAVRRTWWRARDAAFLPAERQRADPDIAFYLTRLADYESGQQSLLTVAPCSLANLLPFVLSHVRSLCRRQWQRHAGPGRVRKPSGSPMPSEDYSYSTA